MRSLRQSLGDKGFTLIELVIIIVVLGIIAAVAIPKYQNIAAEAKASSCKASLGTLRSGISIWYANQAVKGDDPSYPPLDSLITIGVVMEHEIPANPYQQYAPTVIIEGKEKGEVVEEKGGWAYNPKTGEIWPNTKTVGENEW